MSEESRPTKAMLIRIKNTLELPEEIVKEIQVTNPYILTIVPSDYKKILLFPRQVNKILWVRLQLSSKVLQQDFFIAISKLLESTGLKAIYTTGVCFQGTYCSWEGFFDSIPQLTGKNLENEFRKIATVQNVEITVLEVI